MSNEMLILTT